MSIALLLKRSLALLGLWACLGVRPVAAQTREGALILYQSDGKRSLAEQQLRILCSTLQELGWRPPTYLLTTSDESQRLLDGLADREGASAISMEERQRASEAESSGPEATLLEGILARELVTNQNSPSHVSPALRRCSSSAATVPSMAVSFALVPGDSHRIKWLFE